MRYHFLPIASAATIAGTYSPDSKGFIFLQHPLKKNEVNDSSIYKKIVNETAD